MLRSLVGSEMCIRDRYSLLPPNIDNFIRLFDTAVQRGSLDTDDALGLGCLLYTSDAADDLLCVDLGGRRIIKKKNTQRASTLASIHLIN